MTPDTDHVFEESLSDDWSGDLEVVEVPLDEKPLRYVALALLLVGLAVGGRIFFLNVVQAGLYRDRADMNAGKYEREAAPRGLIVDRGGEVLAENVAIWSAYLNPTEYVKRPELREETMRLAAEVLALPPTELETLLADWDPERSGAPLLLAADISHSQLVTLKDRALPTLFVENSFRRRYPEGPVFSSLLGYVGLTTPKDLAADSSLDHQDLVGKSGLELFYDKELRGKPGIMVKLRDAQGTVLEARQQSSPQIGEMLTLSVDAGLQRYFYERMRQGLLNLGRAAGVGLAMDPRNGQVLALINFPVFDNNAFAESGRNDERRAYLTSETKPLFGRSMAGEYSPGSTIKPLMGVAVLADNIIDPRKTIFSPGYLDVPNPFDPENPTRFLDWRYQGDVDLYSAIAQSSDVYFYEVGGGFGSQVGLGISRIREWWQRFGFGVPTGIDLPGENAGFLPSPEWKEEETGRPWLVGDTYNISIGQGDLTVTPIQLLNHIAALANGGTLYRPTLARAESPEVRADLSELAEEIREVQKGMRLTVTSPLGTAHALNDLPYPAAAKTGTAQIENNRAENAFFVGYALPSEASAKEGADTGSPLAILVLVERSRQGGSNALPIAEDVLRWYYENRLRKIKI